MNQKSFLTIIVLTLFCWIGGNAQTNPAKSGSVTKVEHDIKAMETTAKYLGKTKKLKDLAPLDLTSKEKKLANKKIKKKEAPRNFIGRGQATVLTNTTALPKGADPVAQTEVNLLKSSANDFIIEPLVNINGLSSGSSPHDPSGDIGLDYYMQAINATSFRVYDKNGAAVTNVINANTLWNDIGFSSAGDPIILFDQGVNRWIITEFPNGNQLLFAISETSDPTGNWDVFNFSTPSFPDYPKYGIWNNSYVVTTNEQGQGTLPAYFINRQDIIDVVANPRIQRLQLPGINNGPGFYVGTPVDWSGNTPPPADALPMVLKLKDDAWGGGITADQIDIFQIDIDWNNINNTSVTTTSVNTAPFNSAACAAPGGGFACIPQMNGNGIDGLPELIMNQPHYRNFGTHESLVLNFLVNANTPADIRAGIRWIEMRKMPGGNWEIYQEGTYAPDDELHRFNASMAMDGAGNIGLAYNTSSPNHFPGVRFTGRFASDPLGEMTVVEYEIEEGGSANPFDRWGDYAHMSIDPVDDKTFWFTTEYRTAFSTSNTKIVSFQLTRDSVDLGVIAMNTPQSSPDLTATETVEIVVQNFGLDTQMVYTVGYIMNNGTEVIENVNTQILPDSTYTHAFATTVDMSVIGDYNFKLFNTIADDGALFNDTLRTTVAKYPRYDAGITNVLGIDGVNCDDPLPGELVLTNFGSEILTEVTINYSVNGTAATPIAWTGSLAMGESVNVPVSFTGLLNGDNILIASTSMPNAQVDEVMANDELTRTFEAILDGVDVTLIINLDNYADETSWTLSDMAGNVLFEGGDYTVDGSEILVSWCLDPDACYIFTIFDDYGDGICCNFGQGNYSIVDANGNPLLQATGEFGSEETTDFCATFVCNLEGDVDISPETSAGASDGSIMITAVNGVGPFMYSIDGGMNFQTGNVFNGLSAGDFNIVIMDVADCLYEETVTVESCALQASAVVIDESAAGAADGTITITAANGNGDIQYSTNGVIFGNNNIISNLPAGDYTIYVRDEAGCLFSFMVTVDVVTSLKNVTFGTSIEVLPNPTNGVFIINVSGLDRADVYLPFHVYDVSGKFLYESHLTRYNEVYTSEVSLTSFPSGTYLIRFLDEKMNRLVKVVRN